MNRIIEAFTRAHDQVTGVDEIIMTMCVLAILLTCVSLYLFVLAILERK